MGSMTDDPREILKSVGVGCEELDAYWAIDYEFAEKRWWEPADDVYPAILALARLVAKYKWQRDEALTQYAITVDGEWGLSDDERDGGFERDQLADLDRRWEGFGRPRPAAQEPGPRCSPESPQEEDSDPKPRLGEG